MWNLKKIRQISEYNKKKKQTYREQTSGYQWGGGRGKREDWDEEGTRRHQQACVK